MITHKVNINLIQHRPPRRFRFPRIEWETTLGRAAAALTTGIAIATAAVAFVVAPIPACLTLCVALSSHRLVMNWGWS